MSSELKFGINIHNCGYESYPSKDLEKNIDSSYQEIQRLQKETNKIVSFSLYNFPTSISPFFVITFVVGIWHFPVCLEAMVMIFLLSGINSSNSSFVCSIGATGAIGVTISLIPIINYVIHEVTGNFDINAVLPLVSGILLVILSLV